MSDDVYNRLSDFLDKMPGGYPKTDSGVELKILKKIFSPEEAELVQHLTPAPEAPTAIADERPSTVAAEDDAALEAPEPARHRRSIARASRSRALRDVVSLQPFVGRYVRPVPVPKYIVVCGIAVRILIVPLVQYPVALQVRVVGIALPRDARIDHHHLHARAVEPGVPYDVRPNAHAPFQVAQRRFGALLHPAHIAQLGQRQDALFPAQ